MFRSPYFVDTEGKLQKVETKHKAGDLVVADDIPAVVLDDCTVGGVLFYFVQSMEDGVFGLIDEQLVKPGGMKQRTPGRG